MIDGYRWVRALRFPSISIMSLCHIFLVDTRNVSYDTFTITAIEPSCVDYQTHHVPRVVLNKGHLDLCICPNGSAYVDPELTGLNLLNTVPLVPPLHDEIETQDVYDSESDAMGIHFLVDVWPTQHLATSIMTFTNKLITVLS